MTKIQPRTPLSPKTKMLEDAGYFYHFPREIYVNPNKRRVFSIEFVEAASEEMLKEKIMATAPWDFSFNGDIPSGVRRALSEYLDSAIPSP